MAKNKKSEKQSRKLEIGVIYQKSAGDNFYYRYQINGARKTVSLETKDIDEAEQKARRYLPTVKSTAAEVIAAHVQIARTQATQGKRLFLKEAWDKYSVHPGRAMPATVSEKQAYRQTFDEFVRCLELPLLSVREITHRHAEKYADFLKTQALAVDTHNRKIKRLRKIFNVLHDFYPGDNPFSSAILLRKQREEQDLGIRRMSFTKLQELELLKELDNPKRKLKNKCEIKLIFLSLFLLKIRFSKQVCTCILA